MPAADPPPPASGAWREGDHPGERRFLSLGPFTTQSGFTLQPNGVNTLFIAHALSGDSHVCGAAGPGHRHGGWWNGLVGPGRSIDTRRWFVVCANVLGGCQGTTGPATLAPDGKPWGSRFPLITVADMVEVERRFSEALGIRRWACLLGPSLGGMRVLEWLVAHPERVAAGIVIGAAAALGADQIGSHEAQIAAIHADQGFRGGDYYDMPDGEGPHRGLGVARRIAHLTYRSRQELELRFGRQPQAQEDPYAWQNGRPGGRFAIASYLDHQADKLARRFDANTYIALTRAMSLFDLGRGRGGLEPALRRLTQPLTVVGVASDRLFPLEQQQQIALLAPGAGPLRVIDSLHGHDGFLVEADQLGQIVREALEPPVVT
jgi:homoserine O-acetyltransferase